MQSQAKALNGKGRTALLAVVTVCLAFALGAPAAKAGTGCANADLQPASAADAAAAGRATRCLVNYERRKRGLKSMRFNADLQQASDWMANDMVELQYFDHQRDGGPGFAGRITRFGYAKKANGYSLGENIAWATTGAASPREIVRMWMDSPGHRANILRRQFKEQAVTALYSAGGVGGDYEMSDGPFVVYVNQFGTRY